MSERVQVLIGETRGLWIGTFHGLCPRLLHEDPQAFGIWPEMTIYSDEDRLELVTHLLEELGSCNSGLTPRVAVAYLTACKNHGRAPTEPAKGVCVGSVGLHRGAFRDLG